VSRLRRFSFVVLAACVGGAVLIMAASPAGAVVTSYSQGFEVDTSGWVNSSGTIARQPSAYSNSGGYADGVASKSGSHHARLSRGTCSTDVGGGGPTVGCTGPFTRWGGYNSVWNGGYSTQVDAYLDAGYAHANPDSYGGNIGCLTASNPSLDPTCHGTRFDFSSAINNNSGSFLRDFVFNVGTGPDPNGTVTCAGFIVAASSNAFRTGASPYNSGNSPQCVASSGWYTFKHSFADDGTGHLRVTMEIIPAGTTTAIASWTLSPGDVTSSLGCNRYGWFANQEILDLAIDNAQMTGCGTPPLPAPPPLGIAGFHYHACATADCTPTDATTTAYPCTDAQLATTGCTVGVDEYNPGTTKH